MDTSNKYPTYKEEPLYGMYRLKEYLNKALIGRTVVKVNHKGGYDSPYIETVTLDNGYEFSLESTNGCECCGGIDSSLRFWDENLEGITIRSICAEYEDENDDDNGCFTITFTGNRRRKVLCTGDEGKDGFGGWGYGWYVTAGFPSNIEEN